MFFNRNKDEYRNINDKDISLITEALEDSNLIKGQNGFAIETEQSEYTGNLNLPTGIIVYTVYIKCLREDNSELYKKQKESIDLFEDKYRTNLAHKYNITSGCLESLLNDIEKELIYTFYYHDEEINRNDN